ncbi:inositol monophosphatase family protein [Nocardioides euryhalodurans]|uniref:Inositol monophosphatase family protein n=1 Tax=Nocardioides euryhalodurans TaxID=2518370 RepID=A0A4P7GKF9_9ACTN|nr:inositol monophosphatase family protein [Nocardioides euryhalodurans]QBR92540.1 inositol monophosphatase family protein [Nocardioides euryhalodurans]
MTTTDVDVAIAAARAGAAEAAAGYRTPVERHGKDGIDFATEADLASERAVRAVLRDHRPDDAVVGEEYGAEGAGDRTWLVDPICGTLNFAAGIPLLAVNVALREGEHVRVAAVADPVAGDVLVTDGERAWAESDPATALSAGTDNRLVEVDLTSLRTRRLLELPAFAERYAPRGAATSLAVAWVAAGRFAAYVADGDVSQSVHYAAGLALCRSTGCVVTDLEGGPVSSGQGLLVAATGDAHADLLALLARA